jgi:hypothetical protein
VWGSWFVVMVDGLWFMVYGSGYKVRGLAFNVRFRVHGSWFRV